MKLRIRNSTTFLTVSLVMTGLFALIVLLWAFNLSGISAQAQTVSGRLITVHDRGQTTTFITDKPTLGEALVEAGVNVAAHDTVEPSLDETLVASDYQVNIYRARPVTIIDGATRLSVMTPYQTAERILRDAQVTLFAEDLTTLTRSADIVKDGAGLQLTIDRATPLTLDLYGAETPIRTQAETVGEMLKEKSIALGESGRASVPLDGAISANMNIRIWREGRQTITSTESVDFTVKQIQDADRPVGYKEIQTPGVSGERMVTYEVEIHNGAEVSRTEIASITTREPVVQIEIIGMKSATLPYTGGGTKTDWLAASDIPQAHWGYADYMVHRESSWNPNARNASSGACGLAQALPCSKLGPDWQSTWNDPIVSLNWMNSYVNGRYYDGSLYARGVCAGVERGWPCAYAYWRVFNWY